MRRKRQERIAEHDEGERGPAEDRCREAEHRNSLPVGQTEVEEVVMDVLAIGLEKAPRAGEARR